MSQINHPKVLVILIAAVLMLALSLLFGPIVALGIGAGFLAGFLITFILKGGVPEASKGEGTVTQGFTYDVRGNLVTATDENGHTTTYAYDPFNNLVSVTDPTSRETEKGSGH